MVIAMDRYAGAIDEQRMIAVKHREATEKRFLKLIEEGIQHRNKESAERKEEIQKLADQYRALSKMISTTEEIRRQMAEEIRREKKAYLASQKRAAKHFQRQLSRMEKIISGHMETTQAAIRTLSFAIEDIRHRLREMSQQLIVYMQNQAELIR